MIEGQCLCGAVKYQYHAELQHTIICHCLDCQRAQGSLFAFNSPILKEKFILLSGEDALKAFFFTKIKARVFCRHCASPIYSYRQDLPEILRLRLGTVTQGKVPAPKETFFVDYCPDYLHIKRDKS